MSVTINTIVAGGGADGSGGGGGATFNGDSITATTRTGARLDTIKVNGITWTYTYSGDTPLSRSALGGLLTIDISENAAGDYVEDPLTNILVRGGIPQVDTATAWALEAQLDATNAGFQVEVTDCAGEYDSSGVFASTPTVWTWTGTRWEYDFVIRTLQQFTNFTNSATADLVSIVAPKEFLNAKHKKAQVSWKAVVGTDPSASGNCGHRVMLNSATAPYFYSVTLAGSTTLKGYFAGSKTLYVDSSAAQNANAFGSLDGMTSSTTPVEFTINSATTDFTFTQRVTQGVGAVPYQLDHFGVRLHTKTV